MMIPRSSMTFEERLKEPYSLPLGSISTLTGEQLVARIRLVDDEVKDLRSKELKVFQTLRLIGLEKELAALRLAARPRLVWTR